MSEPVKEDDFLVREKRTISLELSHVNFNSNRQL